MTRGKPSGAFYRRQRQLFDGHLDLLVEAGALSPGLAEHLREYGARQLSLIIYARGLLGTKRLRDEKELDDAEQHLAHLYTRLNANTSGAGHRTKGAK